MAVAGITPTVGLFTVETVVESGEETDLEHGSGLGRWVIDWVITNSTGSIEYDTDSTGTTVTVRLPI